MRRFSIVLAALACAAPALAQVSPGPLARPHRELEGTTQCFRCHGAKHDAGLDAQCRACHREIAWLAEQGRGLHAREGAKGCASCHPEHGGENFALIAWDKGGPEAFDHRRAGWPLEGKHATLRCAACHGKREFAVSPAVALRPKPNAAGYVGLERSCGACHEDVHRGVLGADCSRCHAPAAWAIPGFDHSKARFALTGKHREVACAKCHRAPGLELPHDAAGREHPLFKPLPFAECGACHRDPHEARFGAACSRCHVTDDFKRVSRESFDHQRTRFPLRGRHAAVSCARCHDAKQGGWGAKPAFDRCSACHADAHNGQATLRGSGAKALDCAACHDERGYAPSTFTVEAHAQAAYPLEGRHRDVPCARCHVRRAAPDAARVLGPSRVVLRPAFARCADCHADPHGGQLASRPGGCESCHVVAGFKPSTYTAKEHAALALPLTGGHAATACAACHGPLRSTGLPKEEPVGNFGRAGVKFRLPADCGACHADPHRGRFTASSGQARCTNCHLPGAFRPTLVDEKRHANYKMRLDGAHLAVPCSGCHPELKAAPATRTLILAAQDLRPLELAVPQRACADCHRSPHGEQFASRRDGGACDACHDTSRFRPATRFDHERDARFALKGAHAGVPCARCHVPPQDGSAKTIYRGLAGRCEDCHRRQTGAKPK